jgi:hypothetical protein
MSSWSPRTVCSRMQWPIWWQSEGVGHLRRDCQCRFPKKIFTERDQWRQENWAEGTQKKASVSSLPPPCCTNSVLVKHGHDSLNTEGRIGGKSCLVTIDTGASVTVARLDVTTGLSKRDPTMLYVLQAALGDSPDPEGSCSKTVSWALPTCDLGVCLRDHRWIHPGVGCLGDPRCIHGFGVLCALNRQWSSAIVAPQGATTFIPLYQGQQWGGSNSVWQSCSSAAGRTPGDNG